MTVNFDKIYRVVNTDQYQSTNPETYWTKDKKACEKYIEESYYKHCLRIEESELTDVCFKIH